MSKILALLIAAGLIGVSATASAAEGNFSQVESNVPIQELSGSELDAVVAGATSGATSTQAGATKFVGSYVFTFNGSSWVRTRK